MSRFATRLQRASTPIVGGGGGGGSVPDGSNTGIIAGSTLTTYSGDYFASTPGATIQDLDITGMLTIAADNITVHNVRIGAGVYVTNKNNTTFQRCEMDSCWIDGSNTGLTFDACNFHDANQGPHMQIWTNGGYTSNLTIQNCYFHGLVAYGTVSSAHTENIHMGGVHNGLIQNNYFEMFSPDGNTTGQYITANLTLEPKPNGIMNQGIIVDNNIFHGGWYYMLYFDTDGDSAVNKITNNQFFSDSPRFGGVQYPPSSYSTASLPDDGIYHPFYQANNTLDGNPLSLPGGL